MKNSDTIDRHIVCPEKSLIHKLRLFYKIIAEGDGRTLPSHFDPEVLRKFKKYHARFEEIYEKRKD